MKRILIIDDDIGVTNYLRVLFMQKEMFDSTIVNDSREVSDLLTRDTFDVILLDMDMPDVSGIDIMKELRSRQIDTPVVVLTGVSDVDLAVRAMKLGAFDYLTKPVDDDELFDVMNNAIEKSLLHQTISQLPNTLKREDLVHQDAFKQFPSEDMRTIRLLHQAEKIASSDLTVGIWGEMGTGKKQLARAIHRASRRKDESFLSVDAINYDKEEFSAFFFGQAQDWRGTRKERSGILEEATGATLFLDNIDTVSVPVQVKINRLIQTGEYYQESSTQIRKTDVRLITASVHDPAYYASRTDVCQDLFYHLMANSIHIPPIRDRTDDIPVLAKYFLETELRREKKDTKELSEEFVALLRRYDFPENVTELRSIVIAAAGNEEGGVITPLSLPLNIREKVLSHVKNLELQGFVPTTLEEMKRTHARQMLSYFGNDIEKTALELGVSLKELEALLDSDDGV